jgi:uncharacterized protein (TIGR00288 family)
MTPWWLRPPADETPEPEPDSARHSAASIHDTLSATPDARQLEPTPPHGDPLADAAARAADGEVGAADPHRYGEPEGLDAGAEGGLGEVELLRPLALPEEEDEDDEDEDEDEEAPAGEPVRATRSRRRGGRRRGGRGRGSGTAAAAPAEPEANGGAVERNGERAVERLERRPELRAVPSLAPEPDERAVYFERRAYDRPELYLPERPAAANDERKIALFCDFENIALGVRDSRIEKFDIDLVIERLLEKGKIIVKKAYADWERYSDFKRPLHEAAIELIDIPQKHYSGKNSADIKLVVDAMDLSYSKEHLDTFVIMSGDSDFSPLVSKLKENNKYVIGVGVKDSSSALLIDNCDEFIYYEDVWRSQQQAPQLVGLAKKTAEAFELMIDAILALQRENKDVLWGSMVKQTMQRKKPSFNEGYYGYSTFSELLEDAERHNILKLKKDQRSGTYVVTGFAKRK